MSAAKHTPGPWSAGARVEERHALRILTSDGKLVAEARGATGSWSVVLANARLIAAAPALADALEGFLNVGCGCSLREIDSGHKTECHFPSLRDAATAALRAAGRLP